MEVLEKNKYECDTYGSPFRAEWSSLLQKLISGPPNSQIDLKFSCKFKYYEIKSLRDSKWSARDLLSTSSRAPDSSFYDNWHHKENWSDLTIHMSKNNFLNQWDPFGSERSSVVFRLEHRKLLIIRSLQVSKTGKSLI